MKIISGWCIGLALLTAFNLQFQVSRAQGTAFTYQGRFNDNGIPATGGYDLRFAIFDSNTNGNQIGNPLTNSVTTVNNGLFAVTLDFGGLFNGSNYWMQIAVRTNGGGSFIALSPRQPITPTPYAITAGNVSGIISLAQLPANVLTNGERGVSISGTFSGNGIGLTNAPGSLNSSQSNILASAVTMYSSVATALTYANNNNITDISARNRLIAFQNKLNIYGVASNLVDAVLFDRSYNGTNRITYMGRSFLATNLNYPAFVNNAAQWGCFFSNTTVVVQGLPDCRVSTVVNVYRMPFDPIPSYIQGFPAFVSGVVNPFSYSAVYEAVNWGNRQYFMTRNGTNVGVGNWGLSYSVAPARSGVNNALYYDDSYLTVHAQERNISMNCVSNNLQWHYENGLQSQLNYYSQAFGNTMISSNQPQDALTSLWIGSDPFPYTLGIYNASVPMVGELFAVLVFTNVPANSLTNLAAATKDALSQLETSQKETIYFGDSRLAVNGYVSGGIDAQFSIPYWIQQSVQSQTMWHNMAQGSTYPSDWYALSNQVFQVPNPQREIDFALGYNGAQLGIGAGVSAFTNVANLANACVLNGNSLKVWTIEAVGTNLVSSSGLTYSQVTNEIAQYNMLVISNAFVLGYQVVRWDKVLNATAASDTNILVGGLHPYAAASQPSLSQYTANFYNAGIFPSLPVYTGSNFYSGW